MGFLYFIVFLFRKRKISPKKQKNKTTFFKEKKMVGAHGHWANTAIVPKPSRDNVYRFLFTEGVIACQKNRLGKWRATLGGKQIEVPVNHVMSLMGGLIKEQFAWRHFYWFLNDAGVAFMRKYLFLADNVVPNTQRKPEKEENFERRPAREEGEGRGRGGRGRGRGRGSGEGRGAGRGAGRGRGFRSDRRDYHADPNAEAGAEGQAPQRPEGGRGRGRGRGRPQQDGAAPAQE